MKLDPEFKSENNKLYFLDGTEVKVTGCAEYKAEDCKPGKAAETPCLVLLPWSLSGLDEESYNEEFLAAFRDWLKELEDKKQYAFVVPSADVAVDSEEKKEAFVQAMKHTARRIKDCKSVIGFAVPEEVDAGHFIEELSQKHAQYVFFSRNEALLKDGKIVKF